MTLRPQQRFQPRPQPIPQPVDPLIEPRYAQLVQRRPRRRQRQRIPVQRPRVHHLPPTDRVHILPLPRQHAQRRPRPNGLRERSQIRRHPIPPLTPIKRHPETRNHLIKQQ